MVIIVINVIEILGQKRICFGIKQLPSVPWLNELKMHGINCHKKWSPN